MNNKALCSLVVGLLLAACGGSSGRISPDVTPAQVAPVPLVSVEAPDQASVLARPNDDDAADPTQEIAPEPGPAEFALAGYDIGAYQH